MRLEIGEQIDFVDLAGSKNAKETQVTAMQNVEAGNINKSMLTIRNLFIFKKKINKKPYTLLRNF